MLRISCWLLVAASVGWLGQTATAQAIVIPREFSLIRPTFPPPKPNVLAPINVQPLKQMPLTSTNNNPKGFAFPSLRLTAVVPQGIRRQSSSFAVHLYQPRAWAGATSVMPTAGAIPGSIVAGGSKSESGGADRRPTLDW
ncbi:MAG TPA: hypothetical protein VIK18_15315 [Pirellulales bacterium]